MAASAVLPCCESKPFGPNREAIKSRLLRRGVVPTPKILHAVVKKEAQKSRRRSKKQETPPLSEVQRRALDENAHFRAVCSEYRVVKEELKRKSLAGMPWDGIRGVELRGIGGGGERLKGEYLKELREIFEERSSTGMQWLLDDDVEEVEGCVGERETKALSSKQKTSEAEKIQLLVHRLSSKNLDKDDWKFSKLMKQSDLFFTEMHLLKIVDGLWVNGKWRHALSVVKWVYNEKDYKYRKSRFVYTKLLAALGKARQPNEALQIFNMMREDGQIYPDMASYHTIAVTLGQSGLVKELINIIECMRQKPSRSLKNMNRWNWDPCLEPDVIVYNAVLNACVTSHQWKGVSWVLEQMRHSGLKPTGATFGLAMEVMLKAGKYDLVHKYFEKMQRAGLVSKALTYKVLVRTFWHEGKIDEAVEAVRDMEQRGIVGSASVYYELACCLCNNGRWQDAILEVENLKRLPRTKPLEVTFTGMILSSLDGGHVFDCISIFEHMKDRCTLNIGTINAMLKVYGHNDMFANARELFESIKDTFSSSNPSLDDGTSVKPDAYTYNSMLEASASAQQWDYFEYVYKDMALSGYRIDQKKHAWLMVEASKSGKWHLLDHGFDTILEAGEIPHVSIFMEMICRAVARQDFERILPLMNGMAHASMRVGEDQWTKLFQENEHRCSKDKLKNLLNHLGRSELVMEDPVPSLLRSLQFFVEIEKGVESDGSKGWPLHNPVFSADILSDADAAASSGDGNSVTSVTDEALDLIIAHVGNPFSDLPSASEILETWREDRMKDGSFRH